MMAMLTMQGKAPEVHSFQSENFISAISAETVHVPTPSSRPTSIDIVLNCWNQEGCWAENTGTNTSSFDFDFSSSVTFTLAGSALAGAPIGDREWTMGPYPSYDGTTDYGGRSGSSNVFIIQQHPGAITLQITDAAEIDEFMVRDPQFVISYIHSVLMTTNGSGSTVRRMWDGFDGSVTYNF